jgi:hypothetical protein
VILPHYLPGREDLVQYAYEGAHDYGLAAFGCIKNAQVQRPDGTVYMRKLLSWGSCRDVFQGVSNEEILSGFCFTHRVNMGYDATCFIAKVEDILGIQRSSYKVTGISHITWVVPSPWWMTSAMRKSFYTLAIRGAYNYDHKLDNFEPALFSFLYTQVTPTAVKKFMKGYTVYDYTPAEYTDGWFRQFAIHTNPGAYEPAQYAENNDHIARLKPSAELIANRAYELWLQNGQTFGHDQENWYTAEQLLMREAA